MWRNFYGRRIWPYLAGDDGAGSGAAGGDGQAPEGGTPGDGGAAPQDPPAYFSQLRKETREKYADLARFRTLDELAEYAAREDPQQDLSGYIKLPTETSTKEELRAFMTALGVPEKAEDYDLPEEKDSEPFVQALQQVVRENAFRSGLSPRQAANMWGTVRAALDTAGKAMEEQQKARIEGFDQRFEDLYRQSYPESGKRMAAIRESLGHFSALLEETGIGKALEETGALYDERIVKALADYQRKTRGSFQSGATGQKGQTENRGSLPRSKEFLETYGRR